MIALIFDGVLAVTLVALAWRVLAAPDAFEAVVVFITLGLLMALAWGRLAAPDIALAEAAVGAGLTGVLLLDTLGALPHGSPPAQAAAHAEIRGRGWPARVATGLLATTLGAAVLSLEPRPSLLAGQVSAHLGQSGVSHPVTAVLLNFRGYDTWLELGVLLIAIIGVLALRGSTRLSGETLARPPAVLAWLIRVLTPLILMVAGYLLWLGKHAAGGAFQAGVVLGAAGVLLWLAGWHPVAREWLWKVLWVIGFLGFIAAGLGQLLAGANWLEYPPETAATFILCLELGAAISIGATLAGLFIALHFPPRENLSGGPNERRP